MNRQDSPSSPAPSLKRAQELAAKMRHGGWSYDDVEALIALVFSLGHAADVILPRLLAEAAPPVEPPLIEDHEFDDDNRGGDYCWAHVSMFGNGDCGAPRSRHRSAQGGEERG